MYHGIVANTKALCRVCMSSELEQSADLYDASTSVHLSLHQMLRVICSPVFEKPEADLLMPEMPTKVCLVCQNAVLAAYNLHQQCIETDRRLNELVALRWELHGPGGDDVVGDCVDPLTSSSQEVTLSLSVAKDDEIPKQNYVPCDSEADNTCLGCGKTFKSRWYFVRHKNQGWCDFQVNSDELGPASDLPATDRDHSSDGVRPVENNTLLNADEVNTIKVETLEVMDQNDSNDLLQEATMDQHIKCSNCGISFSSIRVHRDHIKAGNCQQTTTYPCRICGKIFDKRYRLRYHKYTHKERVACPQCDETFINRNGLLLHIRRKRCSGIKLRKEEQDGSQEELETQNEHASNTKKQDHHVEHDQMQSRMNYHYYSHKERFPCSMCNAKFRSVTSLQKHLKQKGCSEEHLRCSEMDSSPTEDGMNDPLIEQTSVTDGSSSSGAFGDPLLNIATLEMIKVEEPEIADLQGVEMQNVDLQDKELQGVEPQHAVQQNEELEGAEIKLESKIFVEQSCVIEPDRTPPITLRINVTEGRCENINNAKNLVNICQTCKIGFPSMAALKMHKLEMHESSVECDVCQKMFTSKSSLRMHMKIHTGQKTYACNLCPKRFRTSFGRKHHLKSHSNEPAAAICACDICEMKFKSKHTLKIHKRTIHEGLRPFVCTTCDQKFGRLQHLRRHMRTHTNEKPFKCAICPHAYADSGELVKHVARKHSEGNPYACDRCDKTFRFITELRKHYADHYQAGDDTTRVEELGWNSMALLNMRFAKDKQQQKAEDDEHSE